ncbi:hypothetical protein BS78_K179000 [Paspalum vaginatum]|uniref:Uncharacterized protein n=1 Tax=Paspalum vaginatum TaxID=158149 RepID=A0A9W7XE03_9POAL|nr:hypothetical protein BS78_K179000 [Paspalum vaginatum]
MPVLLSTYMHTTTPGTLVAAGLIPGTETASAASSPAPGRPSRQRRPLSAMVSLSTVTTPSPEAAHFTGRWTSAPPRRISPAAVHLPTAALLHSGGTLPQSSLISLLTAVVPPFSRSLDLDPAGHGAPTLAAAQFPVHKCVPAMGQAIGLFDLKMSWIGMFNLFSVY